jgi:serine/threonine protein kinase
MIAREPCRPGDGRSVSAGHLGVGSVIAGKYSLTRLLGEGAMGTVFEAHHHALDVDVAIKILRTRRGGGDDGSPRERLQREARAAASLGHPGIIRVFDTGVTPDGQPYLVMELLEGEDLASMLDRLGRLAPVTAVQSMLPIVEALAAAHDRQIIHRDLKPENVFLARTAGGATQPKLIDFGVAKLDDPAVVGKAALPLDPLPTAKARTAKFHSAKDIADFVVKTMPGDAPGSLKPDEYLAILAFDLHANGVDLTGKTLEMANLADFVIHP